jgi:hypothetical protein
MSGESPRERKAAAPTCNTGRVRLCQIKDVGEALTAAGTAAKQASEQQLAVCTPLGQQDLSATS